MRPVWLVVLLLFAPAATATVWAAGWGGPTAAWIRPGAQLSLDLVQTDGCTLGFLLVEETAALPRRFATTAGHCVDLGASAYLLHDGIRTKFGTVIWESNSSPDAALIEISPPYVREANPAVLYWGGPTALAFPPALATSAPVAIYGHGYQAEISGDEARAGTFLRWNDGDVVTDISTSDSDSGAPILLTTNGARLALSLNQGLAHDDFVITDDQQGPYMSWVIDAINQANLGYHVRLAVVGDT
jgi:hypothetical protein